MCEGFGGGGVSRELARIIVPTSQFTRFRASANLRNLLGFLTLRLDKGAQSEIRDYGRVVGMLIKEAFPRTYALFEDELYGE